MMAGLKQKQVRKEISKLLKVNHNFNEFLESLKINYPLHTNDEKNTELLQEHLNNISVIFNQMKQNVK